MPKSNSAALIIGNGPSVDQLNPDLFDHFTTFGCNHIGKKFAQWNRPTDNIVITDGNRINEIGNSYQGYDGKLFVGHHAYSVPPVSALRAILGKDFTPLRQLMTHPLNRVPMLDRVKIPDKLLSVVFEKSRATFDFQLGLNFGFSVVSSAIQIASIQGFKTILLTGVDSSYTKDKDYFAGASQSVQYVNYYFIKNPRIFMEPILALLQVYLEERGTELIDCTPGGKLKLISKGEFTNEPPYFRVTHRL